MKKLTVFALLLVLCLCLCASRESEKNSQVNSNIPPSVDEPTDNEPLSLPILTKEATESIHDGLGNSIANYSDPICLLAECAEYIFHSYGDNYQITMIEKSTDKSTLLPIYGTNLSIYDHSLYFLDPDHNFIYRYNFLDGSVDEADFPQKPDGWYSYEFLFVTSLGFIITYYQGSIDHYYCMLTGFNGTLLSTFDGDFFDCGLLSDTTIAFRQLGNSQVTILDLSNMEISTISIPVEFSKVIDFDDGYIYGYQDDSRSATLLRVDPTNGSSMTIDLPNVKATINYEHKNILYYVSYNGTSAISLDSNESFVFCKKYHLMHMTFTSDGYIYATGGLQNSTDTIYWNTTKPVRIKVDGTDLKVLSD